MKMKIAKFVGRLVGLALGTAFVGAVFLTVICGATALATAYPWQCIGFGLAGFSLAMLSELKPERKPKPAKKPAGKVGGITKARKAA